MEHELELTRQAEANHFWFRGFRKFVNPVLADLAQNRRDLRLVDCGCGTGFNLALLRPYGSVWGFDLSAGGVAHARRSGEKVVRADVSRIPFASNTFDIAASFDVLPAVGPDQEAVREMARIVKPGGAVLLTMAALEMLRGDHAIAWREVRRYTPRLARERLEQAGLHAERVRFMFGSIFPIVAAARLSQRALRPVRGARPDSDITVPAAPVNLALSALVSVEAALTRRWAIPIGSSLLAVGRKPGHV